MFGIARARTAAGPDEALLFNAEFTAPQRGALQPTAFVAAFCERRPFLPQHGCSKTVLQMRANNTWRSQTAATALQMSAAALVRAQKTRFKPKSLVWMTKNSALYCASYQLCALR